jgi:hypothetical protein
MMNNLARAAVVFAILLTSACSEAPKPASKTAPEAAAAPAVPISGKDAFWKMYESAFTWSRDLVPLTLQSKELSGVKNEAGKAGQWTVTFVSPSRREAMILTYSVAALGSDIKKGVTMGHASPWNGPTKYVIPFDSSDLSVDSDAAYKTALTVAEPWLKAHPGKEATLTLGTAARFRGPVWAVLWGEQESGLTVFVDAKAGKIVK